MRAWSLVLMASVILFFACGLFACGHDMSPLEMMNPPATPDEALFQHALMLFDAKMYAEAQAEFDQLWSDYPATIRHDNAGYLRGRCRYELKSYNDAISTLLEMRSAHPDSKYFHSAAYFTARSRFELTDYRGALTDF